MSANTDAIRCYLFLNTAPSKMSRFRRHTTLMCHIISQLIEIEKNINKHDSNCTRRLQFSYANTTCVFLLQHLTIHSFFLSCFGSSRLFASTDSFRKASKINRTLVHCILGHHVIFSQSKCCVHGQIHGKQCLLGRFSFLTPGLSPACFTC